MPYRGGRRGDGGHRHGGGGGHQSHRGGAHHANRGGSNDHGGGDGGHRHGSGGGRHNTSHRGGAHHANRGTHPGGHNANQGTHPGGQNQGGQNQGGHNTSSQKNNDQRQNTSNRSNAFSEGNWTNQQHSTQSRSQDHRSKRKFTHSKQDSTNQPAKRFKSNNNDSTSSTIISKAEPVRIVEPVKLFFTNLPSALPSELLHQILDSCGALSSFNRLMNPMTNQPLSSALGVMDEELGALRVLRIVGNDQSKLDKNADSQATPKSSNMITFQGLFILGKQICVKCDDNTKKRLRLFKEHQIRDFARMNHWNNETVTRKDIELFLESQEEDDEHIRKTVQDLIDAWIERERAEAVKNLSQSESLAVQNTLDRFLVGGTDGDTEKKRSMLADQIKRFRQIEQFRKEGAVERERERLRRKEWIKQKIADMARQKERSRFNRFQRFQEREKRKRDQLLRQLESNEREREERVRRKTEGYSSDDELLDYHRRKILYRDERPYYYGEKSAPEIEQIEESTEKPPSPQKSLSLNLTVESKVDFSAADSNKRTLEDELKSRKVSASTTTTIDPSTFISPEEAERMKRLRRAQELSNLPHDQLFSSVVDELPEDPLAEELNWDVFDRHRSEINERLRPWVLKRMEEILGEEEETLVEYVFGEVNVHGEPNAIIEEIGEVFGESEAREFIVQLWQRLRAEIMIKGLADGAL